jgi:hypothetical protein
MRLSFSELNLQFTNQPQSFEAIQIRGIQQVQHMDLILYICFGPPDSQVYDFQIQLTPCQQEMPILIKFIKTQPADHVSHEDFLLIPPELCLWTSE